MKSQVFRDITQRPLLGAYRYFDSQIPVILEFLNL